LAKKQKDIQDKLDQENEKLKRDNEKKAVQLDVKQSELDSIHEAENQIKEDQKVKEAHPDVEKMDDLIESLSSIKTMYTFKGAKHQKLYSNVNKLIDKINNYITEKK